MPLMNRAEIAEKIPHDGAMVLLDEVTAWDEDEIRCKTAAHLREDNPFYRDGRLGASALVEFAAQAMALHMALLSGAKGPPPKGHLVSIKKLRLNKETVHDIEGELTILCRVTIRGDRTSIYAFRAMSNDEVLVEGEVLVALVDQGAG